MRAAYGVTEADFKLVLPEKHGAPEKPLTYAGPRGVYFYCGHEVETSDDDSYNCDSRIYVEALKEAGELDCENCGNRHNLGDYEL
jgi:uncharacterized Zn-finger protein